MHALDFVFCHNVAKQSAALAIPAVFPVAAAFPLLGVPAPKWQDGIAFCENTALLGNICSIRNVGYELGTFRVQC